jgi:DNA-binding CsgD family transcriptional regulator
MRQYIVDRFKAGDTQSKIARDLGISPATVHNYLRLVGVLHTGRRKSPKMAG